MMSKLQYLIELEQCHIILQNLLQVSKVVWKFKNPCFVTKEFFFIWNNLNNEILFEMKYLWEDECKCILEFQPTYAIVLILKLFPFFVYSFCFSLVPLPTLSLTLLNTHTNTHTHAHTYTHVHMTDVALSFICNKNAWNEVELFPI